MKRRVISEWSLATRPPILTGAVGWLLLDRFNAPFWAQMFIGIIWLLLCIGALFLSRAEEYADVPGFGKRTLDEAKGEAIEALCSAWQRLRERDIDSATRH